jgi:spore germination protein KA
MKGGRFLRKNNFDAIVALLASNELNFSVRTIPFRSGTIKLFYIAQLIDRDSLAENIIRPLMTFGASHRSLTPQLAIDSLIFPDDCILESDTDLIEDYVLSGMVVILFSTDERYVAVNIKKVEERVVTTPQLTYTLRGPQDCFTENINTNLSLIRYRVQDKNLRIKNFKVGKRSKTRVAVLFIQDIANDTVIQEIQKRIENIDVDSIVESGELQHFLLDRKSTRLNSSHT